MACFRVMSFLRTQSILVSETKYDFYRTILNFLYCIVLLFYVHGKHLRSCQDGQLT